MSLYLPFIFPLTPLYLPLIFTLSPLKEMKKLFIFTLFIYIVTQNAMAQAVACYDVVPLPNKIELGSGKSFALTPQTQIVCESDDELMQQNAKFLSQYIEEISGMQLKCMGKVKLKKNQSAIILKTSDKIGGTEAYEMKVDGHRVVISGGSSAGVFYGIQTLRKSLPTENADEITLPNVVITDAPRFAYRGMHLDCSRHFFPISFVKRYIDLIAMHNMNVFHWHLSDDQGWRIEIKQLPGLTEKGSVRPYTVLGHNSPVNDGTEYGGFYTQEEARDIVEYARQRHITVIPEIDMPGHMLGCLKAYPELGCTGGPYEVAGTWGVFDDVLCLGNEKTYTVMQIIIDELCDIFSAKYFHIGGDESPNVRWQQCAKCKALANRLGIDAKKLQGYFTNRIEKYINSKGRSIIGWDEIAEGDIQQSATIMSWRGVEPGAKAAQKGHDVIMAPTSHCYFDYYQTEKTFSEPRSFSATITIEKTYSLDPAPASMPEEARKHILGAQANLWSEYVTCTNKAEYQVLPRMGALAEVQWTQPERKNYEKFVKRAERLAKLYDCYGYVYAHHIWK